MKLATDAHLVPFLKEHATVCSCTGIQNVEVDEGKSIDGKASKVNIELCAIRLEVLQTDLLVTMTMPYSGYQYNRRQEGQSQLFRRLLGSFIVEDLTLFC